MTASRDRILAAVHECIKAQVRSNRANLERLGGLTHNETRGAYTLINELTNKRALPYWHEREKCYRWATTEHSKTRASTFRENRQPPVKRVAEPDLDEPPQPQSDEIPLVERMSREYRAAWRRIRKPISNPTRCSGRTVQGVGASEETKKRYRNPRRAVGSAGEEGRP